MNSPKSITRIAGVLYLIVAIFAAFPYSVFNGLYIAGDAAATAANIVAKAGVVPAVWQVVVAIPDTDMKHFLRKPAMYLMTESIVERQVNAYMPQCGKPS